MLPAGDPRRDANFKRWFGESKVVDDSGKPLVVYHGTPTHVEYSNNPDVASEYSREEEINFPEFTQFITDQPGVTDSGWLGQGAYFTPDPDFAHEFGNKIIPAYLKVENPFIIRDDNSMGEENTYDFLESIQGLEGIPDDMKLDFTMPKRELDWYSKDHPEASKTWVDYKLQKIIDVNGQDRWAVMANYEVEGLPKER